jgi:hypothetical protein
MFTVPPNVAAVVPDAEMPALAPINPLNVAVEPCKDPARVIPPEALIPAVNLVSALKVPPTELIPLVAFNSPLTDTDEPVKVSGDPTALTSIKPLLLSITILQPLVM